MANLLEKIKEISLEAACELQKAEFCTDSEITSLTENDLRELLPTEKLKVRKKVYEKIQQNQIHAVFKGVCEYISQVDALREAFKNDHACLSFQNLRKLKQGVDYVKEFLDAQIDVLEKFTNEDQTVSSENHASSTPSSAASDSVTNTNTGLSFSLPVPKFISGLLSSQPQIQDSARSKRANQKMADVTLTKRQEITVKGKIIVSGKTLDRHKDVLKSVNGPVPGSSVYLHLKETICDEESQVTVVFCPVVSRLGSDVQGAMKDIPGDKPVILVMMHHNHTAKCLPVPRTFSNAELIVSVFFHESVSGLLSCPENDEAIFKIQQQLLKCHPKTSH